MAFTFRVQTECADRSFSSVQGTSVASALVAAALLGASTVSLAAPARSIPAISGVQQLGADKSYADVVILQNSDLSGELISAMQEAFDRLADSQQELDARTQELLYANLWDLYD